MFNKITTLPSFSLISLKKRIPDGDNLGNSRSDRQVTQ